MLRKTMHAGRLGRRLLVPGTSATLLGAVMAGSINVHQQKRFAHNDSGKPEKEDFDMKDFFSDWRKGVKFLQSKVFDDEAPTQWENKDSENDTFKEKVISPRRKSQSNEGGFLKGLKDTLTQGYDLLDDVSDFASLASTVKDGLKPGSGEAALNNLIQQSRQVAHSGDYQNNQSFIDVLKLFDAEKGNVQSTLVKTFGHIDFKNFDPTSMFYFLEKEDEVKNPSWKRRRHRFMFGVKNDKVEELHDALYLADVSYLDSTEEIQSALKGTRDGPWEMIYSTVDSYPGKPAHYIALKSGTRSWEPVTVLLVVRGTKTVGDVFTDALMEPTEYGGGKAHQGFVRSGRWLVEKHKKLFDDIKELSKGGIKIQIVGHSLGAGACTIAGLELRKAGYDVSVTGFGCPAVLNKEFSENCKEFVTTVVADADVIPRSSGATVANRLLDIIEFDWTNRALRDVDEAIDQLREHSPIEITEKDIKYLMSFVEGGINKYVKPRIKLSTEERITPVLYPPGTCVHLYRDGRGVSCSYVPCTFFNEIDVAWTMIDDHLIQGYDALFLQLLEDR